MKRIAWNVLTGTMAIAAAWGARTAANAVWSKFSDEEHPADRADEQPSVREAVTALVAGAVTTGLASLRDSGTHADREASATASPDPSAA